MTPNDGRRGTRAPAPRAAYRVIVSDLHVNSQFGLWPPGFEVEEGGRIEQNRWQRWLWECWVDFTQRVNQLPGHVSVLINGDLVQGINPARDTQVMTVQAAWQRQAAQAVLDPLLQRIAKPGRDLHINRGTGFHDGPNGADAETVAQALKASRDPDSNLRATWERWETWQGKVLFSTHHIGHAVVYPQTPKARALMVHKLNHVEHAFPIPDLDVRSHVHHWDMLPDGHGRLIITTPCWQLKTEHAMKKVPQVWPSIGGVIVRVEGGRLVPEPVLYPLPKPRLARG